MNQTHPIEVSNLALLDIQNNLTYIDSHLEELTVDETDKQSIKAVTSPYLAALYDCLEELMALGKERDVFIIDPVLQDLTDIKTEQERIAYILDTIASHNQLLKNITDSLIARRSDHADDRDAVSLIVLMTESVGNILRLSSIVNEQLTLLSNSN